MRLFLSRFPALAGLLLFVLLCAALAGSKYFPNSTTYWPVTTTADSGPGSLRNAIQGAGDGDVIYFVAELHGQTIALTSGELAINSSITIGGPGPSLLAVTSQSSTFRIFHVLPGHTVTIQGLTIRDGLGANGGGILNDHSALSLTNCTITENGASIGGGIYNDGSSGGSASLTIFYCSITNNAANSGGGIANSATSGGSATVSMWNSSVSDNQSLNSGGGIASSESGANLTLTNCIVSNNQTGESGQLVPPIGVGGGIFGEGTTTIIGSTIRNNVSYNHGGGIAFIGTLTLINSTVSGNEAAGNFHGEALGDGGGILSYMNSGTLTLTNSTLSNNSAAHDGGGYSGGGTITNSTISGNSAHTAGGGIYGGVEIGHTILKTSVFGANFAGGPVTSRGYNLSSDNGGGFLTATGDQINTDPVLGPLQNNGGPTFTHELLSGSPAIDAGDPGFTPPPYEDQRGRSRVFNGRIDIGSLEVQPTTPPPSPTPSPTPCGLYIPFKENFDEVTAPALPPGWTSFFTPGPANCVPTGTCALGTNWATTITVPDSPPHCVFHNAPGCVTDSVLETPPFLAGFTLAVRLSFRHSFDLENGRDGAVLEISINGGPFVDFAAAGGNPGYNGTIAADSFSPIAGRAAWTGNSGGYRDSNFISFPQAAVGESVRLRFRLVTDCGGAGAGWRIDNILVGDNVGCQTPTPTPTPPSPTPTATFPPPSVTPTATATPPTTVTPTATPTATTPVATASPTATTPAATATPTATTPAATPTPTPTPSSTPARALNISTRLRVETGDRVMIGGFIISGSDPKRVAVRGLGPSLVDSGITGVLADPTLELRDGSGALISQNDDWQDTPTFGEELSNLGLGPPSPKESGFVATLPPGASYTAILAGKNGGTGVGLVEVYDTDQADSQLANISTRGFVQTGDNVMIGGFILGGSSGSTSVAVRGIGPSLSQVGLSNVLADPTLELRDSNGMLLIANDNWQDDHASAAQLTARGLAPQDLLESGIFASLPPGAFTAILAGKNVGIGIGLVEIYNLQ